MIRLAVIGMGHRSSSLVRGLRELEPAVRVVAVADPNESRAREQLEHRGGLDPAETRFFADVDDLLEQADGFDALVIGTRCDLHTPLAVKVAKLNLPLLLEKPVATSTEQLKALHAAYAGREDQVVVSFPLRVTPLFEKVLEIVASGRLGIINQVQAQNNVGYGGVYFGDWYRDFTTTGGLWLQKATHDFDYLNALASAAPVAVAATHTQRVYGGEMPEDLWCSSCDHTEACPESPQHLNQRNDGGGMAKDDHPCAFSTSIRNQDAGSALLLYANGLHAVYSQNFIARNDAHSRGARIVGYDATLTFDWSTESIHVMEHHRKHTEQVTVEAVHGHSGGDHALVRNFLEVIRGEAVSRTPLTDGLLSATMCLAARSAANHQRFEPIVPPGQSAPAPLAPSLRPVEV